MAAGSKFLEEHGLDRESVKKVCIAIGLGLAGSLAAYGLYSYFSGGEGGGTGGDDDTSQPSTARSISARSTVLRRIQDLKTEGNSLFSQKKYSPAIERYTEAIAVCLEQAPVPETIRTELAKIYQNRAAAAEKLERWTDIRHDCSKALELDNRYVKALFRRAKANQQLGDLREAILDSTAGNILESFSNQEHLESAEKILKQLCSQLAKEFMQERKEPPPLSSSHVETFLTSFVEDPVLEGLRDDRLLNGHDPQPSGYARARQSLMDGEYAAVIPSCSAQLDSDSQGDDTLTAKTLLLRATFYLLQGCQAECEADLTRLDQLLTTLPDSLLTTKMQSNARVKRSMLLLQLQRSDIEAAVEALQGAAQLDPSNADLCIQQAQVALVNDNVPGAMALYDRAVELKPDSAVVNIQRDFIAVRVAMERLTGSMIDIQAALSKFEGTVEKYSKCAEGHCLLGQLYMQLERFEAAMEQMERAIALTPRNAAYFVHKAVCTLSWRQDADKAMAILQEALLVDPYFTMVHENMGSVQLQRGDLEAAVGHFSRGLECVRTESEALQMLLLLEVTKAQQHAAQRFGLSLPSGGGDTASGFSSLST